MYKEMHVFDMDGTLVDSSHRYRTQVCPETGERRIDLDHWRENEDKCSQDSLLPMAKIYKMLLKDPECFVIVATARVFCNNCWVFLLDNLGLPNQVIFRRGNNDRRGGVQMKLAGIRPLLNLKHLQNISEIVVYEDNINYLHGLCTALNAKGVFVPSKQGY